MEKGQWLASLYPLPWEYKGEYDKGIIRVKTPLPVKHQLLILNRSRARAPVIRPADRIIAGLCAIKMHLSLLLCSAIVLKRATILSFHRALVRRKYRLLCGFAPKFEPKTVYICTQNCPGYSGQAV